MPMATFIRFPMDACLALGAKWCPNRDLSVLHERLQRHSRLISKLSLENPMRQLLATLRLRKRFQPSLSYAKFKDDLHYWLTLQSGCPLRA